MKNNYKTPQIMTGTLMFTGIICDSLVNASGNTSEQYNDPQDWGGEWK